MLKELIREVCILFHLDLTKNLKYDRQTRMIMRKFIAKNANCIDIGCHKGEILQSMIKLAPDGHHYAFEPIPEMYQALLANYSDKTTIYPYALSDQTGSTTFQFVKNAPAYSGIRKRQYDIENPDIEEIKVEMKKLDDVIPVETKIDFIKIDVEGAEYGVINGGKKLISKHKPVVIFECGIGASDFYGTKPEDIFNLLANETGLSIYTLDRFLSGNNALTVNDFVDLYNTNKEYYFIAAASSIKKK